MFQFGQRKIILYEFFDNSLFRWMDEKSIPYSEIFEFNQENSYLTIYLIIFSRKKIFFTFLLGLDIIQEIYNINSEKSYTDLQKN